MFEVETYSTYTKLLKITLPEGKTNQELLDMAILQMPEVESEVMGFHVNITGRCTNILAGYLSHRLAHICKSIAFLDPKEGVYVKAVWH